MLDKSVRDYQDHSKSRKTIIALGIFLGIFLILTIIFVTLYGIEKNKELINDVCLTPYCIKAANLLLESIDETVQPCENFFEFACGKWLKNHRIPEDAESQGTSNLLRTQLDNAIVDILSQPLPADMNNIQAIINARRLYDSCINESTIESESIDEILSLINNEFGGWPILQGSLWNISSFNFSRLLFKLRQYNHSVIFNVRTSIDDHNSSAYFIRISQSDLTLEQRTNYNDSTKLTNVYREFIRNLARSLTNDTTMIDQDVEDIYNFEKNISIYHWTSDEQRARQYQTVRSTIGNLSMIFNPHFDFLNYLREIYSLSNITLINNDIISISELHFLRNASSIINQTSSRILQNYFVWRFIINRVSNMPRRYRLIREPFHQIFRGTIVERPRSITCGKFVNANMGFAVSKVYIKQYFDENARNQSLFMINNIRNAFIEMLKDSTWMDAISKTIAIDKALSIDVKIDYSEYLGSMNTAKLEKMYREYIFDESYISNILKLLQIKSKESLQMLRETVDRKAWGTSPLTVARAFYTRSKNQITLPAGILQMPYFNKDAPKYLNYGGIGVIIGHEIAHGFDDNGRQFDKDGNRIEWWPSKTIDKFIERKKCIINQYRNYTLTQINRSLNGSQTQREDMADNVGIKEAFYAYQVWTKMNGNFDRKLPGLIKYSAEQMFFINYGQIRCSKMTDADALNRVLTGVHSPSQFRVLGPTSNFDEFDRVFSCQPGQNNSRIDKCIVW